MTLRRYDLTCTVDPYRDGWQLQDFLVRRFRYHSEALWVSRLAEGAVLVNGEAADAARVVHAGDRIDYHVWHEEPAVDFTCTVLHEDDAVLAVAKSGNLPVHAGGKYIRNTLIAELRQQWGKELRLAHRLDRETSGVVVLARTRDAARALEREFHGRRVTKAYLAVLRGDMPADVTVDAPIGREDPAGVSSFRRVDPRQGKEARTRFLRVATGPADPAPPGTPRPATLVLAVPESGRTNQIRVHAAHLGHPVLGDKIYGVAREVADRFVARGEAEAAAAAAGAPRHLLHCLRMVLRHPDGTRVLDLLAPPPPDFTESWGGPLPDFGVSLRQISPVPREPPPGPLIPRTTP